MASKYAIETVFKVIDNITAPLDKIGIKGKAVGRTLKNEFTKTEQQLANVGKSLKTFGKYAIGAGIGAIGVGLGVATKQFIDFDSSLHAASAAFSDMNPKAADFGDKLDFLGKAARDVAAVTEFNAQQTASALSTLARAGIDSTNAIALLPNIADLATSAMVDIDSAVNMATGTLSIFGKLSDDPKILANNMKYISDVLAKTADMANHSIEDVVAATTEGGDMFKKVNQSIENFNASLVALAKNNITGSKAGVAMRNIMLRLSAPAASGEAALKKLGIRTKDSAGNLLNIVDIIKQFETSLKGVGTADAAEYLDAIFGKQNIAAAQTLISAGSDKLLEYTSVIDDSFGAAAQKAGVMRQSLKNQIAVLMSGLTELGFKFVDAFAKKGSDSIQKLTEAVTKFDPTFIINFLTTVFNVIGKVVSLLWKMRIIIISLAIAWGVYKAAMIAAVVISKIMGMVGAVQALMGAQQGMNVVQAIFNVLLTANPIGMIITAIGALIAIIILCVKYWDEITAAVSRAWEWIKKNQEAVLGIITIFTGPFGVVISIVREFWNEWERITQAFKNGGIVAGLKQIGATILSAILAPLQGIFELIGKIPGVGKPFKMLAGNIDQFRNQIKGVDSTELNNSQESDAVLSPVSQAQQAAYYSRQDTYQHAEISVKAEPGTSARVSKPPASPNFNLAVSGGAGRDF